MTIAQQRQEIIRRLDQWIDYHKEFVVGNNRFIEVKTLRMMCNAGYLNDRGWNEVEFYVSLLEYTKAPEYKMSRESNIRIKG